MTLLRWLLCRLFLTFGQDSWPQSVDPWPAVPQEDLALDENPADPGSAAVILERQVYTDDEKRMQTEFVRIKVLTEAGRSYADVEIPW